MNSRSQEGSGSIRAAGPEHPAFTEEYLDLALRLLKKLNGLKTLDGAPLPSVVEYEGFEPWWFVQHQVLWSILVPYCRHRDELLRRSSHETTAARGIPSEADLPTRLLGVAGGSRPRSQDSIRSAAARCLGWLSRLGLALFSLASLIYFRLRRHDTLFLTLMRLSADQSRDFRLEPVYRELETRGYRFAEYLSVSRDLRAHGTLWRNLLRLRRPMVVFGALSKLAPSRLLPQGPEAPPPSIDLPAEEPDRAMLEAAATWTLRQSRLQVREIRRLAGILSFQKIRKAVLVDDSSQLGALVAACKLCGVPTLGVMHGNFTRFNSALFAYGFRDARRHTLDLYGLWSEHFASRLLAGDLYRPEDIAVSGPLRAPSRAEIEQAAACRQSSDAAVRVLVISEQYAVHSEVAAFLERLVADPRFQVQLKVRPDESSPAILEQLGPEDAASVEVVRTGTVFEAFAGADVVVGTHSTVLYEAILARRPVVVLHTSFTYGHDLVHEGLAELARLPEEIGETVLKSHATDGPELENRKRRLWGDQLFDGAGRIFDRAESALWKAPLETNGSELS